MKKLLLTSTLALAGVLTNAQVFFNDDFNSSNFTVGNVVTSYAAPGQGGWQAAQAATAAPNAALDNFKIEDLNGKKVMSVLGSNGAAGTKWLFKDSIVDAWEARELFQDVLHVEFDFFTGATTNSLNTSRIQIIADNGGGSKSALAFNYVNNTRVPGMLMQSNPCDVIAGLCPNGNEYEDGLWNYTWNATGGGTYALPADTWVRVGLAWDSQSGECYMAVTDIESGTVLIDSEPTPGTVGGGALIEQSIAQIAGTGNSVAGKGVFGSYKVSGMDGFHLLSVNDVTKVKANVSVYPNPTADVLNFNTKATINSAFIYDMSGKVTEAKVVNNSIDVRNLAKGTYLVTVKTSEGTSTNKFIKK